MAPCGRTPSLPHGRLHERDALRLAWEVGGGGGGGGGGLLTPHQFKQKKNIIYKST